MQNLHIARRQRAEAVQSSMRSMREMQHAAAEPRAAMLLLQEISGGSSKAVMAGNPPYPYPLNRSVMLLMKSVQDQGNPPRKKRKVNADWQRRKFKNSDPTPTRPYEKVLLIVHQSRYSNRL